MEEEESVFITMTDMTISFLLIVMILLAFFATQLGSENTVPLHQYERIQSDIKKARNEISDLKAELALRTTERDEAVALQHRVQEENTKIREEIIKLEKELARLRVALTETIAERDSLLMELKKIKKLNPLEIYLSQAIQQRGQILLALQNRLRAEFQDLQVMISPEQDALRFQGEGLFRSGSSRLGRRQRRIVKTMGRLLDKIFVCFTLGERAVRDQSCGSGNALIEAVQIEGHTDSDGTDVHNLKLSTARANETLLVMLGNDFGLLDHKNLRGQPVMSVSGYGEMRPIASNQTDEGKSANRRIDLRIIMYAPSTVQEVEEIGRRLDRLSRAKGGTP